MTSNYQKEYRNNHKKEAEIYRKTYKQLYPEKFILAWILQRCNNLKDRRYKDYGGRGIKCLITAEEIRQLMIRDNYWKLNKPSIDRIDNDSNYCLENCRFIEMSENSKRTSIKQILQYDLEENFIKEWKSLTEASNILNLQISNISHVLSGRLKQTGGYIWRYK
jgi:hypothetical protein